MAGKRILTPEQEKLVAEVRRELINLQAALARLAAAPEDETAIERSILQLEELFLLVVVGEFNSGKSTLINALVGERVLEEGVTPTTTRIQVLRHGTAGEKSTGDGFELIEAPADLLVNMQIVDTPGTNAIERKHELITRKFVPRADLVFFVTSADRPFTESERAFLELIRDWGKKIVIVINKIDILQTPEDAARVEKFVSEHARTLLGVHPEVFPLAARPALRAKQEGSDPELAGTRFDALERYFRSVLDESERLRLKLLSPLGVARRLAEKHLVVIEERLELLKGDLVTIEEIQNQLAIYERDMTQAFNLRLAGIKNVLHEFENRGEAFFEEVVRLGRVFDLMNRSKIKADFERQVVADAPKRIEELVNEIIDWMISSDLQQWQVVRDQLARRRSEHSDRIVSKMNSGFDYDRVRLLDTVGRSAQRTLESYDREMESNRMAESVRLAVANAALLEVGAVGLGTAVTLLASTSAADITGLLAAGILATLGFFVIPRRRRVAKRELREKIAIVRGQLLGALGTQFEREIQRSVNRIKESVAPYTRFVRGERDSLIAKRNELQNVDEAIAVMQARIKAV